MALLAGVWTALTGEAEPPAPLRRAGELDLLPSVFPVLELGAAAGAL